MTIDMSTPGLILCNVTDSGISAGCIQSDPQILVLENEATLPKHKTSKTFSIFCQVPLFILPFVSFNKKSK